MYIAREEEQDKTDRKQPVGHRRSNRVGFAASKNRKTMTERKFKPGDRIREINGRSVYTIKKLTPYGYQCEGVAFYLSYFREPYYEKVEKQITNN